MQASGRDPAYVIGPNDALVIQAANMDEIGPVQHVVDSDGYIDLPTIGKIMAAGLSVVQLEAGIASHLDQYVREPSVVVTVVRMRSEPIFFNGAFKNPGIYTLQGRRTLVEMISSIGGMQPNARHRLKLTRRKERGVIPLPNPTEDPDGRSTTVEISVNSLQQTFDPAQDIELLPYDTVAVERSEMIYVAGQFGKVGGFELDDRESLSVAQLVALAGGLSKDASPGKARVLRPVMNTSQRAEIPINIKDILAGKANDFPLLANDVLYVPSSRRSAIAARAAQLAITMTPAVLLLAVP
jgi:polysaccharide export outer membrane protein